MLKLKISKTMKDIQWSLISIATSSLSHLLLRIVLGREFGPSGLGIYTLVFTIYIFGMQFAAFGISAALTKHVAEFSDELAKTRIYIRSGLITSIFTGTLMGAVLYLCSGFIASDIFDIPEMGALLRITALCFPFIAMHKATIGAINGFRKMKTYALLDIALNASVMVMSVFLAMYMDMGVKGAVLGFVIPTMFCGLVSLLLIRPYITHIGTSIIHMDIMKNVLHFGFYVVLGNSIGYIYTHIDSVMIGYYLNEADVGIYAISAILIQGVTLIPSAIQRVTGPMITRSYAKNDIDAIKTLLKSILSKVFLLALACSIFLYFFGKVLIIAIFGEAFLPAYTPLLILLIGYTVYSMFMSIGTFYASIGQVQLSYKVALFSAVLNVIMNALLIPPYGINGAAMATSFSLVVLTVINFLIIKNIIKESYRK